MKKIMIRSAMLFSFVVLTIFVSSILIYHKNLNKKSNCLILKNVQYYDVENDQFISKKNIYIYNGLIEKITDIEVIKNVQMSCEFFDTSGLFILPGLIDSHTHLLAQDKLKTTSWKSALEFSAERANTIRLLIGKNNIQSMLLAGFTSVRDLGNSGEFLDEKLKIMLAQKNSVMSEIIYSGPGWAVLPTQIDFKLYPNEYRVINESTNFDELILNYKKHNVSWLKIYADNSNNKVEISKVFLKKIVELAHKNNLKVSVHAEYAASAEAALQAHADSIEHFYQIPLSNIQTNVENRKKIFIVITDNSTEVCKNLNFVRDCSFLNKTLASRIKWIKSNKFNLVFGSDAVLDFTSGFNSRGEASLNSLINLSELGLTNSEIIRSATLTSGLMLDRHIGKIVPGYAADFILLKENPIMNILALNRREGVIVKGKFACQSEKECSL